MRLGYSEFSFGYAFTENLIRSASMATSGAPYFPNLYDEGRLGYDVRMDFPGCPLFLQYKLPERMIRDTADEISNRSLAGIVTPFFRMYLMKRSISRQHELLVDLEYKHPDSVYYVAPEMSSHRLLNAAYNSTEVHLRSVLFSPREIGHLPDDKQHIVAYREGLPYAWFCSEPREIGVFRFENIVEHLRRSFEEPRYRTVDDMARATLDEVLQLVPQQLRDSQRDIRQRIRERRASLVDGSRIDEETTSVVENLLVSRELSRIGLGAEYLVAQPSA